jgi:putative DNA primase/helicase
VTRAVRRERSLPRAKERPIRPAKANGGTRPKPAAKGRIVQIYDYRDEARNLRSQTVRYEPKRFSQRRPDGQDGWIWNLDGVEPVPYRLPELLAAPPDETVFVPEGEKDVDALRDVGLAATCNPMGAGKWREEFGRHLEGRDVVVLPDNDKAGRRHARDVAAKLAGHAKRVRILEMPEPHKDVSDWIGAGGTMEELLALVAKAPDADEAQRREPEVEHTAGLDLTEDGVALAYAAEHEGRVVFDHTARRWAEWDGSRWRRDGKERVFNGVRDYVRRLREGSEDAPRSLARMGFAAAVERGVRADPRIAVEHDAWDADPWALGVPGGVVDLRTGELRVARPDEFISRQTSVAPAPPGTPAPLWQAFLREATGGDAATIGFLRRFAGYALTGDVSEEVLVFLYGPGGNGKGVFLSAITAILADYAEAMPMEAFTAEGGVRLEYYRAQMAGPRLLTASETETGATWAESQIKELTGNEAPVSARHPHGRPFTFRPRFKLAIVGNHAPRLKGRSAAMERRLRVVPFDYTPPNPDHELKGKLRSEYPAILRWMVEGCLEWQRDRLGTAPAIQKATGSYFEAQDAFGRWLAERCILDPTLSTRPGQLQADFAAWTRSSGETSALSAAEFREQVERTKGLRYVVNGGARWVRGIGLRPSYQDDDR